MKNKKLLPVFTFFLILCCRFDEPDINDGFSANFDCRNHDFSLSATYDSGYFKYAMILNSMALNGHSYITQQSFFSNSSKKRILFEINLEYYQSLELEIMISTPFSGIKNIIVNDTLFYIRGNLIYQNQPILNGEYAAGFFNGTNLGSGKVTISEANDQTIFSLENIILNNTNTSLTDTVNISSGTITEVLCNQ